MDSINQQQKEENHRDLLGKEGIDKIRELTGKGASCFFCTIISNEAPFTTRPMSVQQVDEEGRLWFLSANDSHKNEQLSRDPQVQLLFQGSSYSDFLHIYGIATISSDKEKIKELWQPILKTWFTDGVDDARISVICVEPLDGYYWDTKHNMAVGLIKRIAGAITGKTMDDSIEGTITL